MMKRWLRGIALAVFSFVFLGACTGPMGTALSGLLGASAMFGGQSFLKRTEADIAAKYRWRFEKQEYVTEYTAGLLSQARDLRAHKDFKGWRETMDILLKFHDSQHPETLIVGLKRRIAEKPDVAAEDTGPPGPEDLLQP